jgi:hypothetical protein
MRVTKGGTKFIDSWGLNGAANEDYPEPAKQISEEKEKTRGLETGSTKAHDGRQHGFLHRSFLVDSELFLSHRLV